MKKLTLLLGVIMLAGATYSYAGDGKSCCKDKKGCTKESKCCKDKKNCSKSCEKGSAKKS